MQFLGFPGTDITQSASGHLPFHLSEGSNLQETHHLWGNLDSHVLVSLPEQPRNNVVALPAIL